jgi:hypothetical protein
MFFFEARSNGVGIKYNTASLKQYGFSVNLASQTKLALNRRPSVEMKADRAAKAAAQIRGGPMKRLIFLITSMAITMLSGLAALPVTASANPIGQSAVVVPAVNIRILHSWKIAQGGVLHEYRDESLGTSIAPDLILTHNHYSRPQSTWLEETYVFEDVWGRSVQWQPRSLQLTIVDAETMLIRLPAGAFPDRATVADRTTVNRLAVGAWLTITYWDDATRQMLSHDFQIVQIKNGLATLADPDKHINRGDSGGGAFWQGRLIGNTKSIYADGAGNALGLINVALAPARVIRP